MVGVLTKKLLPDWTIMHDKQTGNRPTITVYGHNHKHD